MFVISFIIGAGYLGPQTGKLLAQIVEAEEFGSPGVQREVRARCSWSRRIELLLLWATVVVMVVKPG